MTMSKRTRATANKENIDPDDIDFREPKQKITKGSGGKCFASSLSEAEMADCGAKHCEKH